ncbi:MAG: class I SAM-dependent methyltransferase [Limisphaerales bacterium]
MSAPNAAAANASFEFEALNEAVNYRRAVVREFAPVLHGTVVELGAGIGQVGRILMARPEVRRFVAVEPDASFHARLAAAVGPERMVAGSLADLPADVAPDAIVAVNVFEHIEDDEGEMARAFRLLQPQRGSLGIFVPARPEIHAPLDDDFGHFRRYTRPGLRAALERAGFRVRTLRYFNGIGYLAWWWAFCVRRQRGFSRTAVRFFDRVVFPPAYWFESRVCSPPLGQSLVALAQAE